MAAPENYVVSTLKDHIGHDFGLSEPVQLTQHRINTFADCTGDHQWIHTNPEMAKKMSPFGGTVAHGYLTLSLIAGSMASAGVVPKDAKGVVNYGLESVRFPAPVLTGSSVRTGCVLTDVQERGKGQYLITVEATVTAEGSPKPACVGKCLALVIG